VSEEFINALREAGFKFDGHVTNGSLEEQLKVIREFLKRGDLSAA
jgi:hypothetical protein